MAMTLPVRVYYEDTDAGGIVYHANFLKFCERARTELLRAAGFDHRSLADGRQLLFVVRRLEADYLAPARLDEELVVESAVTEVKNSSFLMKQTVSRADKPLFEMTIWLVCINLEGRPVRVPDDLKDAFKKE